MKRNALVAAVLAVFAGSASAQAVRLDDVLKRMKAAQNGVRTLEADFVQRKQLALLAAPEVSSGRFYYQKPSRVLWLYSEPKPLTMLIAGGTLTTYYPDLRKAEKVAVGPVEDRMFKFMGAAGSVAELSKSFDFRFVDAKKEPSYRLELTPRTPGVRRRVRQINLWIDKQSYLTSTFEYVERNGDRTRYEFQNVRVNAPIPADRFTLNLPPGVRVEK